MYVPEGYLAETVASIQYITLKGGVIRDGSVVLPATAVVPGPDGNTPENTITVITNPQSGIMEVTNVSAFEGGRNTETDAEFRARYYISVDFAGGVNIDAIVAAIYEGVEAVIAVIGEENDTDFENEHGLPPHSIEIVAYGGLDEDIAKIIFQRKAAGIQTFGDTVVPVLTSSGQLYDVHFNRPVPRPVWVRVYNLVTNDQFPLDGIEQIKASIVRYIGGNTRGGLNIGKDVICVAIPTEVFKVSGVVDFKLKISGDGVNYGWKNIDIAPREKAVTEESLVDVS